MSGYTILNGASHLNGNAAQEYAVMTKGGDDLTVNSASSPGWVRVDQDRNQSGNPVSGIKHHATMATFRKTTLTDDETLIIDSALDAVEFAVIDNGSGPA